MIMNVEVPIYRRRLTHAIIQGPGSLSAMNILAASTPQRQTTEATAYDITAWLPDGPIRLAPLTVVKVPTGLFAALPKGASFMVCSRSGLAKGGVQVINAPGIIDSDYRDEICVLLSYIAPPGSFPYEIVHGMRIAQLLYVPPMQHADFRDVEFLNQLPTRPTTRTGGFGSTGIS